MSKIKATWFTSAIGVEDNVPSGCLSFLHGLNFLFFSGFWRKKISRGFYSSVKVPCWKWNEILTATSLSFFHYCQKLQYMKEHYNPRPSEIVQRFKFNTRFRQPVESISTYVSQLRSLAEFCNFRAALDMLRDRLVCGINDSQIQRRLLLEKKLTFENALSLALG